MQAHRHVKPFAFPIARKVLCAASNGAIVLDDARTADGIVPGIRGAADYVSNNVDAIARASDSTRCASALASPWAASAAPADQLSPRHASEFGPIDATARTARNSAACRRPVRSKSTKRRDSSRHVDKNRGTPFPARAMMTRTAERIWELRGCNPVLYSAGERGNRNTMRPIAHQIAELNARIERARRLVAEHRLQPLDVASSKSYVIVHDLTNWLYSLEARREELLRQSHLIAQRDREVA
jgi:hypothetical protein